MWRQLLIDEAFIARMRRVSTAMMVRRMAVPFGLLLVFAIVLAALSIPSGDWDLLIPMLVLAFLPLVFFLLSVRVAARGLVPGTYIAYAVTPDGTFHVASVSGTTTVNPGYVTRLTQADDVWLVGLASGATLPVPRELLPDADAALLVRHLPGRPAGRTS